MISQERLRKKELGYNMGSQVLKN